MDETVRVAIAGFGHVARAFARQLLETPDAAHLRVVAVTDRTGLARDPAGLSLGALLTRKEATGRVGPEPSGTWSDLIEGADVLVDLLPTDLRDGGPSRGVLLEALQSGRDAVTAGKGVLVLHGDAIEAAARRGGGRLRHSGAIFAGTPILELLGSAFRGDRVERFEAVLNGTTNHLLTRMEAGLAWEEAMAEARSLGIAEADPALDLLGLDAAAKAVLLARACWGRARWEEKVVDGILGLDEREVRAARARGMAIRLVARGAPAQPVRVAPVELPREHPLVTEGTQNAVRLHLRHAGAILLRGPGAGARETAAAVLGDVLSLAPPLPTAGRRLAAAPSA